MHAAEFAVGKMKSLIGQEGNIVDQVEGDVEVTDESSDSDKTEGCAIWVRIKEIAGEIPSLGAFCPM